jgi:hypothetical protein
MIRVTHVEGLVVVELVLLDPLIIIILIRHKITLDIHLLNASFMINGIVIVSIDNCSLLSYALLLIIKTIQKVLLTCLDIADLMLRVRYLRCLGAQLHLIILRLRDNVLYITTLFAHIRIATLLHQIVLNQLSLRVLRLILPILTSKLRL